jgi:hypothetical protein
MSTVDLAELVPYLGGVRVEEVISEQTWAGRRDLPERLRNIGADDVPALRGFAWASAQTWLPSRTDSACPTAPVESKDTSTGSNDQRQMYAEPTSTSFAGASSPRSEARSVGSSRICAADSVWSLTVVGGQPSWQGGGWIPVAGIDPPVVRPLLLQGALEPFDPCHWSMGSEGG